MVNGLGGESSTCVTHIGALYNKPGTWPATAEEIGAASLCAYIPTGSTYDNTTTAKTMNVTNVIPSVVHSVYSPREGG